MTLVAWGLDDPASYFAHPVRVGYVLEGLIANWIEVLLTSSVNPHRTEKNDTSRENPYTVLVGVRFMVGIVFYPFADRRSIGTFLDSSIMRWAGLLLYIAGYSASNWAIMKLGHQWTGRILIQEGHRLVTDGPYARIRHPHYLGMLLVGFGTAFLFRSWIGLLLEVLIEPAYFRMRIGIEEKMLHNKFGDEWEEYSRHTWKLVPLLY